MCMVDDADPWEFFSDRDVKSARKEHRCDECQRMIRPGEPYYFATGKYDGYVESYHVCAHCRAASAWLQKACGGSLFTMVGEDLREHWAESESYRSTMLRALIDGMGERWHDGADPVPDVEAVRASVPTVSS